MGPDNNPSKHPGSNEDRREIVDVKSILGKYKPSPRNLSLLAGHFYDLFVACGRYLDDYKALAVPGDPGEKREQVAETLSHIDILLEDIEWHAKRARKEIDKFLEHLDKDS